MKAARGSSPGRSVMEGHIFTTLGWLPAERVELRESVTHDDEHVRLVRVDKYVDGVWVGNDINGQIKTGHEFGAIAQSLS